MYRVWELTEKEKGKYIISSWTGDCYSYSVFDSKEEYEKELARLKVIEDDYKQKMRDWLNGTTE